MCCGSDQLNQTSSPEDTTTNNTEMNHLRVETEDTFASLLELAANNDVEAIKLSIDRDPSCVDEPGLWYGRQKGSKAMVNDHRTPLMVAATYGSIDVIKLILSLTDDVNRTCGSDQTTALHCAASGGAVNAVQVVKLLLAAGADLNLMDADGQRAGDVIVVPPKLEGVKLMLQELLSAATAERNLRVVTNVNVESSRSRSHSPPTEEYDDESPFKMKSSTEFKKEYPIDPSLPDIKNSIYSTDEFRMYSFKVRPCSRAYSHDWTECPFVHPGENARRRDPRKFHYSSCRRGDMCEFAHGVFECWLHPAQYRTRLCKDGTGCARRVCFFAHVPEELRPLYESTGSAVLSPRSNAADYAAALSLLPGSPSAMSPLSPSSGGNNNGMSWPQPNVPALQLPGSNLRSSRLRSSFNARDEMNMLAEYEQQQLLNEFNSSLSRSGRMKSLPPSNLEDLFSAESSSSPRFNDSALASAVFSPTHKSAVFNQFQQQQQQQQQGMLSPINTSYSSPKSVDHSLFSGGGGRMSPRNVVEPISPMSSRVSMLAQCVKQQQQQQQQQQNQFRSLRSREQLRTSSSPVVGSPVNNNNNNNAWSSQWGSSNGKPDWGMSSEALGKLSFDGGVEPDVSWVQSLVKENPTEAKEKAAAATSSNTGQNTMQPTTTTSSEMVMDHAGLEAWIEQMQLDQFVAQQN
ncbi:hypothetical protein Bca52824_029215 [Brassica carinata]|uniref:AtC3H23-like CCCH zinc finger domain-containing protein n=1 Tax=Brassica carinata TaxID=52824 RepID=A0A8X7VDL5_BRACI|nr:hypothetical protein Bca52824_029215 [Brassica carinata]